MAKVNGPLFSLSATGKIADAVVYFPWKGLHIVRQWLKPSQPRSAAVMNVRLKMKALGKVSKVFSLTSSLAIAMRLKTPNGSVWAADWIGVAIKQYMADNAAWDAFNAESGSATAAAQFVAEAVALGLVAETLEVEGKAADHPVEFPGRNALYALAKACFYREVKDEAEAEYTDPAAWDAGKVTAFKARMVD